MNISVAFSTFTELCNHPHCKFQNIFITLKGHSVPIEHLLPFLHNLKQALIWFLCLWIFLLWVFHTKGFIDYVASCVWLLSLDIMNFRFIYVVARISSFLWIKNIPLYIYTNISLPVHPLIGIFVISAFWPS